MRISRLLRLTMPFTIMSLVSSLKIYSQNSGADVLVGINIPSLLFAISNSKYVKNPIGACITSKVFLSEKVAIVPSIRYDNFNYKPLDKRVADYAQLKIGVAYFDNLLGKLMSDMTNYPFVKSYSLVDGGLGIKLNDKMTGNNNCFAYSIGYGLRWLHKRMVVDGCSNWANIKLEDGKTASWFNYTLGFGYHFGK